MKLDYVLPQQLELEVRGRLFGETVMYCVPYDLNRDMRYTAGFVAVTQTRLFLLEDNALLEEISLESGMVFECVELNSSGRVEMKCNGGERTVVCFSMEHVPRFCSVAQILNSLSEKEIVMTESSDTEQIRCSKCGRAFLRKTHFCINCDNKLGIIKRLVLMAKPFWGYYLAIIVLFWLNAAVLLYQPVVNKNIINDVLNPETRKSGGLNMLFTYVGILALLSVVQTAVNIFKSLTVATASAKFTSRLRSIVHNKIQSLKVSYLETKKTGELMHRVTRDTERIQNFIDNVLAYGINELFLLFAVTILLFVMNWRMALFVLFPTPLILYIFRLWRKMWRFYFMQWKKFDRLNTFLNDILRGIRVVKAFGQEEQAIERFKADAGKLRDITVSNERKFYTIMPITNFIFGLGGHFLILYCGNLVISGDMSIGELVQLSIYASYFYQRVEFLTAIPRWLNEAVVNAQRVFEILDAKSAVQDAEQPVEKEIEGEIKFENVTFGYLSYKNVLKNINLDVKAGEMIGFVGHSGAGKSTMINLIMRMYEPQWGKITVDGIDMNKLSRQSYQSQLGVVLQETFLFSGSILENIRYAKPDATTDEVIRAAKTANAHEFIINFPTGYDTRVGENGARLSGGERQRIAIARAILVNPRVLILDEATASVDTETEKLIQDALARVIKNRTTFAIAHRLSTLKNADRIVVLDNGKILEMGGHEELINKKGKYYDLVMAQKKMSAVKAFE